MVSTTLAEISAITTIVGFFVSSVAWYWERKNRKRLEVENQRRIWSEISKIRGIMVDLEKDEVQGIETAGRLQAVGKLTIMLRDLLREASLTEKNFSLETIHKWRAVGKLASDWQEQLALTLLATDEIYSDTLDELMAKYGSCEELPTGHPMKAPITNVISTNFGQSPKQVTRSSKPAEQLSPDDPHRAAPIE